MENKHTCNCIVAYITIVPVKENFTRDEISVQPVRRNNHKLILQYLNAKATPGQNMGGFEVSHFKNEYFCDMCGCEIFWPDILVDVCSSLGILSRRLLTASRCEECGRAARPGEEFETRTRLIDHNVCPQCYHHTTNKNMLPGFNFEDVNFHKIIRGE